MVVLGAVILVFVFWGMWTGGGGGAPDIVAKVDGKAIKTVDYQKAYRRQLEQYRKLLKGQMSDDVLEQLNLRERTLNSMINRALIVKDAKRKGIKLTDSDLQSTIQNIPDFQVDGSFNKERYRAVLQANRMMPNEFEEGFREDLIIQRAQEGIIKDLAVPDEEVKRLFTVENRKVNLNYLAIEAATFRKDVSRSSDEEAARRTLRRTRPPSGCLPNSRPSMPPSFSRIWSRRQRSLRPTSKATTKRISQPSNIPKEVKGEPHPHTTVPDGRRQREG